MRNLNILAITFVILLSPGIYAIIFGFSAAIDELIQWLRTGQLSDPISVYAEKCCGIKEPSTDWVIPQRVLEALFHLPKSVALLSLGVGYFIAAFIVALLLAQLIVAIRDKRKISK